MTAWDEAKWRLVLARNPQALEQHERHVRQSRTPPYLLVLRGMRKAKPVEEGKR